MNVTGIICEYNPFHHGHAYQLQKARENGADVIICVMSGHFVQRGTPAFCDKYTRAAMALAGGADIVLELPYPWCAASAQFFAEAGLFIVKQAGANVLCFGAETDDIDYLQKAALSQKTRLGSRTFFDTLLKRNGTNPGPNDLLTMAYLRAMQSSDVKPLLIPRIGTAYDDPNAPITRDTFPSAAAIRAAFKSGQSWQDGIPQDCLPFLTNAIADGTCPTDPETLSAAYLTYFRALPPALRESFAECGGGIGDLLCKAANRTTTYTAMLEAARAKHVTDAHLRRAALFALTGTTWSDLEAKPAFSLLLGANTRGTSYLSDIRKKNSFPIITKPADAAKLGKAAGRQLRLWQLSDSLFVQTLPQPEPADAFFKRGPVIID